MFFFYMFAFMWLCLHGRIPSSLELDMMDGRVRCNKSTGMGLQDRFRIPRVLCAEFLMPEAPTPGLLLRDLSWVLIIKRMSVYVL